MSELRKAVLITGASTGIGAECALHFDRLGYTVYAGVRRAEDAQALSAKASARLQPLQLDVTDAQAIAAAKQRLRAELADTGLAGLVNNAGIAVAGPLETVSPEAWRYQFEVNVIGQVAVTQAFLPLLRQARGRIINMGSIAGRTATPTLGPYCASKFALEALTDALRMEVQGWGIEVVIVEPGVIATPIWDKSVTRADDIAQQADRETRQLYTHSLENIKPFAAQAAARAIPAAAVAKIVEQALTAARPRTRYLVGVDAKLSAFLARILPDRWRDKLITWVMRMPQRA